MASSKISNKVPRLASETAMQDLWAQAARDFEAICGKSLLSGPLRNFDDVQRTIENVYKIKPAAGSGKAHESDEKDKWEKAQSVALKSLRFAKMLLGVASGASSLVPIPSAAASIATSALGFVFDMPEKIVGYNETVDGVFGVIAVSLSRFQIYTTMRDGIDPRLFEQISRVMASFVRLCAHVVTYRQGSKWERFKRKAAKAVLDEDGDLQRELDAFHAAVAQKGSLEGTLTLALVAESHKDIEDMLKNQVNFTKISEKTLHIVQETSGILQKTSEIVQETSRGVKSLSDDAERSKQLVKIRESLDVPASSKPTCTDIYKQCLPGTGDWIWTSTEYQLWLASVDSGETPSAPPYAAMDSANFPNVLVLSGPPSSGKTSAVSLIVKKLEVHRGRTYVAHHFFPPSTSKPGDSDKNPVHAALMHMAFQIAQVDPVVRKLLVKASDTEPAAFREAGNNPDRLDILWSKLRIGSSTAPRTTYTLVFDGIENLSPEQAKLLLTFLSTPTPPPPQLPATRPIATPPAAHFASSDPVAGIWQGRVRVLVSGTDDLFASAPGSALDGPRIRMELSNGPDMKIRIDDALQKQGILQNARPRSPQWQARNKIHTRLPEKVDGNYSRLQSELDEVIRVLCTRKDTKTLDKILSRNTNSQESAIKALERSLTEDEIQDLKEILKWVAYCKFDITLKTLEEIMFISSGTKALVSLKYVIERKFHAVLGIRGSQVYLKDGVLEYLKDAPNTKSPSGKKAMISMTITITNVEQETVSDFIWDLSRKAIRDRFQFKELAPNHSRIAIRVDEFEALQSIVELSFKYILKMQPSATTNSASIYIMKNLMVHLNRLRQLDDGETRVLKPRERQKIGQYLYELFKDDKVFQRHRDTLKEIVWSADDMKELQAWLRDHNVTRKLDRSWREEVSSATNIKTGPMKWIAKMVIESFFQSRSAIWTPLRTVLWVIRFARFVSSHPGPSLLPHRKVHSNLRHPKNGDTVEVSVFDDDSKESLGWWCQQFLGIADEDLDSLWYERLGDVISAVSPHETKKINAMYQRAIDKGNYSWLCHRGMGKAYLTGEDYESALRCMEAALETAEQNKDTDLKPELNELIDTNIYAGLCAGNIRDYSTAEKYYLAAYNIAPGDKDDKRAKTGWLGYVRARLHISDAGEETRRILRDILAEESGKANMATMMRWAIEVRQEPENVYGETLVGDLIERLFASTQDDVDLLRAVVEVLHMDTKDPPLAETDMEEDDGDGGGDSEKQQERQLLEDEIRGTLLFYRGKAVYRYQALLYQGSEEAVNKAIELWTDARSLLSHASGSNGLITEQQVTQAMAIHYFQDMMDDDSLKHVKPLKELASGQRCSSGAVYLLGAAYARHGERNLSMEVLRPQVETCFQFLSDDVDYNDDDGMYSLCQAMASFHDFENAATAIQLYTTPDLVTRALSEDKALDGELEAAIRVEYERRHAESQTGGNEQDKREIKDNVEAERDPEEKVAGEENEEEAEHVLDKGRLVDLFNGLAQMIVQTTKSKVPDSADQPERIKTAKAHVDSLVDALLTGDATEPKSQENAEYIEFGKSHETNDHTNKARESSTRQTEQQTERQIVLGILQDRVAYLEDYCTQNIIDPVKANLTAGFVFCNGRKPNGGRCENRGNLRRSMYHCIYCPDIDLCGACFRRLQKPDPFQPGKGGTACSLGNIDPDVCNAKHCWIQFPPQCSDVNAGLQAKHVLRPRLVVTRLKRGGVGDIGEDGGRDNIGKDDETDGFEEEEEYTPQTKLKEGSVVKIRPRPDQATISVETWKENWAREWGLISSDGTGSIESE